MSNKIQTKTQVKDIVDSLRESGSEKWKIKLDNGHIISYDQDKIKYMTPERTENLENLNEDLSNPNIVTVFWTWATEEKSSFKKKEFDKNQTERRRAENRIRELLTDNLYERRVISKSGSMEFNRLSHYKTSKRLYSQAQERKNKEYHYEIMIDASWSMFGEEERRIENALESANRICELLEWLANVNVTIYSSMYMTISWKEFMRFYKSIGNENIYSDNITEKFENIVKIPDKHTFYKETNDWYIVRLEESPSKIPWYTKSLEEWYHIDSSRRLFGSGTDELIPMKERLTYLSSLEGENNKTLFLMNDGKISGISWCWACRDIICDLQDPELPYDEDPFHQSMKNAIEKGKFVVANNWYAISSEWLQSPEKYAELIKESDVNVVAFGMWSSRAKKYCENYHEIKDPSQIYNKLVKSIEKTII